VTPVPSSTLDKREARQTACRARFMRLVEALRRETNRVSINRCDSAHSAPVVPDYRASDRLLHLLHEYGVRSRSTPVGKG
jgi:hypothetical protein